MVITLATNITVPDLLEGKWQRLLDVYRFGNRPSVSRITVASHSWLTTMLAMFIFDSLEEEAFEYIDYKDKYSDALLRRAIVHDIEECILGDIPLEQITFDEVKQIKKNIGSTIVEDVIGKTYVPYWSSAKNGAIGIILSYADMLSAYIEAIREVRLGNTTYSDVLIKAPEYLNQIVEQIDYNDTQYWGESKELLKSIHELLSSINQEINLWNRIEFGV